MAAGYDFVANWSISRICATAPSSSGPIFSANHHWAMARGEESLKPELQRRRVKTETERQAVPAPPGPPFTRERTSN